MMVANRSGYVPICVFCAVSFFVQPFLTLLIVLFSAWFLFPNKYWIPNVLAIIGAAYNGIVNTTKQPVSDLAVYLDWFESAKRMGYLEFLGMYSREPIFYTWMYLISFLTGGDKNIFVFLTSWLPYFLISYSIIIVCKHVKTSPRLTAMLIVVFLFLPPMFSVSAHLVRQFLAASLVALFFAKRLAHEKSSWWIIAIAIFIHYSAIIFVPLALLGMLRRLSPTLSFIVSCFALTVIYVVSKSATGLLSSIPVFGLVFIRVAAEVEADVKGLTDNALTFIIVTTIMAATNLWGKGIRYRGNSVLHYDSNLNITVLSIGLIVVLSSLSSSTAEIGMRFYFYLYVLAGLIVPIFANTYQATLLVVPFLVSAVLINYFYIIENGVWHYTSIIHLLFFPIPLIWGAS